MDIAYGSYLEHYGRKGMKWYQHLFGEADSRAQYSNKSPSNLSDIMKKEIKYSDFNGLKSHDEVASSKSGDCHSQVMYEMEELKKLGYEPKAKFFIEVDPKTGQGGITHSFAYYNDNGKVNWFENAWGGQEGIHSYDSETSMLKDIERKHFSEQTDKSKSELIWGDFVPEHHNPGESLQELVDICLDEDEKLKHSADGGETMADMDLDYGEYLEHFGRLGMKWYKHIFGDRDERAQYNKKGGAGKEKKSTAPFSEEERAQKVEESEKKVADLESKWLDCYGEMDEKLMKVDSYNGLKEYQRTYDDYVKAGAKAIDAGYEYIKEQYMLEYYKNIGRDEPYSVYYNQDIKTRDQWAKCNKKNADEWTPEHAYETSEIGSEVWEYYKYIHGRKSRYLEQRNNMEHSAFDVDAFLEHMEGGEDMTEWEARQDELEHYGRLGMKWYQHRFGDEDGRAMYRKKAQREMADAFKRDVDLEDKFLKKAEAVDTKSNKIKENAKGTAKENKKLAKLTYESEKLKNRAKNVREIREVDQFVRSDFLNYMDKVGWYENVSDEQANSIRDYVESLLLPAIHTANTKEYYRNQKAKYNRKVAMKK